MRRCVAGVKAPGARALRIPRRQRGTSCAGGMAVGCCRMLWDALGCCGMLLDAVGCEHGLCAGGGRVCSPLGGICELQEEHHVGAVGAVTVTWEGWSPMR